MALTGTAAQWTSMNPVLPAGETGYETDTGKTKRGNGTSPWTSLAYDGSTYLVKGAAIVDTNGNTVISLDAVASAVNYARVVAAIAGSPVTIRIDGTDSDVGMVIRPKGTGSVTVVDGSNNIVCRFGRASSAVNYVQIVNAATGVAAKINAAGETNAELLLGGAGTGKVRGNIVPRVGTTTSSATPTINTDNYDRYNITAQDADITSMTTNLSGTPAEGQHLWIAITGTAARAITWGSSFEASTVALPTTTVTTNRLDVEFVWNSVTSKWRCVRAV